MNKEGWYNKLSMTLTIVDLLFNPFNSCLAKATNAIVARSQFGLNLIIVV